MFNLKRKIKDFIFITNIIALLNAVVGLLWLVPYWLVIVKSLAISLSYDLSYSSLSIETLFSYPPLIISFIVFNIIGIANLFFGYKLYFSKREKITDKIFYLSLASLYITVWLLIYFSFVFSLSILIIFLILLFSGITILILWHHSRKLVLGLTLITILVSSYSFVSNFEENYCWEKANQVENKDISYKDLTDEEKRFMGTEAIGITGWLRVHLNCHHSFNLVSALREQLFNTHSTNLSYPSIPLPITPIELKPRDKIIEYQVAENDTLDTIAQKFNISIDTIKRANNISNNSLKPGQILKILPVTGVIHIVAKGDTIYSIANKYHTDVKKIIDFPYNSSSNDKYSLNAGQTIIVPDGIKP